MEIPSLKWTLKMSKYLLFLPIVMSTFSKADEYRTDEIFSNELNGLVAVTDSELSRVSGQTGSPSELQTDIDNKSDTPFQVEVRLDSLPSYTEEIDRTTVYHGPIQ